MKYRLQAALRIVGNIAKALTSFSIQFAKYTFSQTGEDAIIREIFAIKKISKPFFVDIGAFHPWYLNNTALLYLGGSRGINIEPNAAQYRRLRKYRSKDINLNIGVADRAGALEYIMFTNAAFNTFSPEQAIENERKGFERTGSIMIEVKTINDVLSSYAKSKTVDLLTIDAEGLDLSILRSLEYSKYGPRVISVETSFNDVGVQGNSSDLTKFVIGKGYFLYAHTPYNAIFVSRGFWQS